MSEQRRGRMQCPYCHFAVRKDLVGSRSRFECPQCGRALAVGRKYLFEVAATLGAMVFMMWLWARFVRGMSFWGFDYPLMIIMTFILLAPIVPLLPRELATRSRPQLGEFTTLNIGGSGKSDPDYTFPDEEQTLNLDSGAVPPGGSGHGR